MPLFNHKPSIQTNLGIGLFGSIVVVFLILWSLVSYNVQELFEQYTASRLQHDIDTLISATDFNEKGQLIIDEQRVDAIYNRPYSGHYYSIAHKKDELRSRSLWDQKLSYEASPMGQFVHFHVPGPRNQPLIVVSSRFSKAGKNLKISVAEDLTPLIANIDHFKNLFAILAIAAFVFLLLIQSLILKHGLNPLSKIKAELKALEQGKINKLNTQVAKEIYPMVDEVNQLISIMDKRLTRSRSALSDFSHAIKKPLTILYHQLEKPPKSYDSDYTDSLKTQISRIKNLSDSSLKRARVAGNIRSGSLFNIEQEINLLLQSLRAMYPNKALNVEFELLHGVEKRLEREDGLELFGNVLDNAFKWANQQIYISSFIDQQHFIICIEDDGPGSTDLLEQQLPERGKRYDETTQGHGFGLAIAADIVSDYGADIRFEQSSKLGGLKVLIKLP